MSRTRCFLVSDLHGDPKRYAVLFEAVRREVPDLVFMAGDLLPHRWATAGRVRKIAPDVIADEIGRISRELGGGPRWLMIFGNDDERSAEQAFVERSEGGRWELLHGRAIEVSGYRVLGYPFVPPTPFLLKDWERYDVGRFVDPGCVSPEQGYRTVEVDPEEVRSRTIAADLDRLAAGIEGDRMILLAHSPPYKTRLDRAALDGKTVDHVPMDVHVGSVAIRRFIEDRCPLLTLHGHIHEAPRVTGVWCDRIGPSHCFTAAHDGPELALVRFDLENLEAATRELL